MTSASASRPPLLPHARSRVATVTAVLVVAVLAATYASIALGSSRLAGEQVWAALRDRKAHV